MPPTTMSRRASRAAVANARPSRIRVTVRVRPPIAEDVELGMALGDEHFEECTDEDPAQCTVQLRKPYFDTREFTFDTVLGRHATQAETYEAVGRPVVDDVLEGFNGTILAYGQTGTGKTYTIYGPLSYWRRAPTSVGVGGGIGRAAPHAAAPPLALQPQLELSGIVTRAALQIFAHAEELKRNGDSRRFRVTLSSLQIWQEAVSDLLGERGLSGPLNVREDPERGVYAGPAPCTLHPVPCTLTLEDPERGVYAVPVPCTLHPAPCTLHPRGPSAVCTPAERTCTHLHACHARARARTRVQVRRRADRVCSQTHPEPIT